jgi:hypothetical protein
MKCVDRYGSVRTYTAVSAAVVKYYYSQSRARACRGRQKGRQKDTGALDSIGSTGAMIRP